jgi:hypothetical protein
VAVFYVDITCAGLQLDEYMTYVAEVLAPPAGVPASAVSHLLAIFDAPALVATLASRDAPQAAVDPTTGSQEVR